ncbi:DUF1236 domain-containing protein [Aquamicrobium ahrensii]|uniref:DUF1236 domain-containing protein n=1 Tax=Aquamicrobium ahrensii TaxID=469551 RepID=A0ABV2KJS9_9HYPH
MKMLVPIFTASIMLAGTGIASAQDVIVVPEDRPDVYVVQPEQRPVIREYVQKNPVASINLLGLEVGVGSRLPDTVVLYEIPDTEYRYVVIDDQTVVVDPRTNEIIDVLD